jgi:hypothetical protein
MGRLRWQSLEYQEAFSILACYHLTPSAVSTNGVKAMVMHLKSTEGTGLTKTDMSKATKEELLSLDSIDVLAKQIGIFMCICGAVLGEFAPVSLKLEAWTEHIQQYKQTYCSMQEADIYFMTNLACCIDRRIQLYLRNCCRAESTADIQTSHLSFSHTRDGILSKHPSHLNQN